MALKLKDFIQEDDLSLGKLVCKSGNVFLSVEKAGIGFYSGVFGGEYYNEQDDGMTGVQVMVKVYLPEDISIPCQHERYLKEHETLQQLNGVMNVNQLLDVGKTSILELPFFVLSYLGQTSLMDIIKEKDELSCDIDICKVVLDSLFALRESHTRNIAHGDVRASNIIFNEATVSAGLCDLNSAVNLQNMTPQEAKIWKLKDIQNLGRLFVQCLLRQETLPKKDFESALSILHDRFPSEVHEAAKLLLLPDDENCDLAITSFRNLLDDACLIRRTLKKF